MADLNNEAPVTTSPGNEKIHLTNDHDKPKKRSLLEDDFFSLSSSFDKKKRKHKHKSREATSSSPIGSERTIKAEEPTSINPDIQTNEKVIEKETKLGSVSIPKDDSKSTPSDTNSPTTLPLLDKEQILREIEQRVSEREAKLSTPLLDDSDEEEVQVEIVKSSPKTKHSAKSPIQDYSYKFAEADEKKRRYIIKIISKLPAPQDSTIEVDLACKGMKSFSKIIKSAVDFYKNIYSDQMPQVLLDRYNVEICSLVWVEGKLLVHSYYTPRMLRIPPPGGAFNALVDKVELMPPTTVHFFLIPKDNSENFMNVYPELRASAIEPEIKEMEESTIAEELSQSSSENEDEDDENGSFFKGDKFIDLYNEEEGVFSIGLKGKDNIRISCKVTPETKIESLLKFYLKKKGIDETSINLPSVKMIFDDEELNLHDVVADTELEDDFEIQIIM